MQPIRLDRWKRASALVLALWGSNSIDAGMASAAEVVRFVMASEALGEDRAFFEELLRQQNPALPPANAEEAKQYLTLDNLRIGRFDLNDDGVPELFVEYSHSGICGSAGCMTDIFRKQDSQWIEITGMSSAGAVYVLDERIGGWRTVCSSESGIRWGKSKHDGKERYEGFCISKQCEHELEEAIIPSIVPTYNRDNSAPLCKDSPVSKKFG